MAPEKSGTDTKRRRFLALLPLSGVALLAACSRESTPVPAPTASKAEASPPPPAAAPAPAAPAPSATAAQGPMVDEKDAQAISLAYVADAARADKAKIPNYTANSHCKTCALFQGAATDAAGGCPLFAGKRVAAQGVCSAWAKKA